MSGKFALIIANTEYSDPKLAELTAPGKDAEEFARVLKSPDIAAFDKVNTLFNEDVFNVNLAIEDFFALKKPDDLLVLYFSGHGIRDEYGSLFLAVKNTDRARLRATAIRSNYIREAMDYSRSKRQVLILDCCNSGAFAQGTKAEIGGSIGTASSFEGTGYGRVVLTASDSTQFAWEGDKVIGETVNSLFTHFLVKGLEGEADRDGDGSITVDELYDYAYEQIVSRTPKQTPGKWSYKQQGEIILRQNIRIEDTKPIPLPDELTDAMKSSLLFVREGAVRQLEALLVGRNLGLARSARLALEKIAKEDDSRSISRTAADILERIQEEETLTAGEAEREAAENAAREKEAREKAEQEAAEKAEQERQERERLVREEKFRKEKEAAEKVAREKAEKEAKEKAEREAAEKAAREKEEHERLAREEKARKEKEAAERAAKEKAEREAAEQTAKEKAVRDQAYQHPAIQYIPAVQSSQPKIRKWIVYGAIALFAVTFCISLGVWVSNSILKPPLETPVIKQEPSAIATTDYGQNSKPSATTATNYDLNTAPPAIATMDYGQNSKPSATTATNYDLNTAPPAIATIDYGKNSEP